MQHMHMKGIHPASSARILFYSCPSILATTSISSISATTVKLKYGTAISVHELVFQGKESIRGRRVASNMLEVVRWDVKSTNDTNGNAWKATRMY